LDMAMIPNGPENANNYVQFITLLKELVADGKVSQSRIDEAVRRILRVKLQMGLFASPATDPKLTAAIGSVEHRQVARECVQRSLVLLKNTNHTLPLLKTAKRIVVVGKAADDLGIQCGGWTISWQGSLGTVTHGGTTILQAIRKTAGPETKITYSPDGANVQGADVAVVVVGEMPYAEMKGDRKDLHLSKQDASLIEKLKKAGVPVVTLLLSGRPLILDSALGTSDAFVAAWLPGSEGQGVADVLFGDFKPTGKLPRNWPRENQYSNQSPLFPRGFGLTYP
ncbi:MAG: beta-glucosidase, partial [Verrucomicrobia bacterium]